MEMRHTLAYAALMFMLVSLASAQQQRPEPPPVFGPPTADELSSITHPDLRTELLWMAFEDQEARRSGG